MNGLNALNEEKMLLVRQYIGLLDTIEEAFANIFLFLEELRIEDADHLWDDVSLAFGQIHLSNQVLAERPEVLIQLTSFTNVWEKAQLLHHSDYSIWEEVIGERIYPAFTEWSREINKQFRPYFIN
ncbi:hypothetical protein LC048_00580 [Mesobacillus subterraneus]|uniref:hypothetical protein n=1 Tax=Mesobacillus subterraneus TaxID=285983 RepID=UPI001CFCA27A|nr:hypothetical protein [Mesobacillus subterraneus]WLR55553.1 hypothetical protein LC048_00580 [Mesobacillus subterraneus]